MQVVILSLLCGVKELDPIRKVTVVLDGQRPQERRIIESRNRGGGHSGCPQARSSLQAFVAPATVVSATLEASPEARQEVGSRSQVLDLVHSPQSCTMMVDSE